MGFLKLSFIPIEIQIDVKLRNKLLSYLKPKETPSTPDAFAPTTAAEGATIPVFFGTVFKSDANVCWYGDIKTEPIKAKGGKK